MRTQNWKKVDWGRYWRDHYDSWAIPIQQGVLDSWCKDTETDIDFLEFILKENKKLQILDISCGWGRHVLELKRRGYNVTGLDYSFSLLKLAQTTSYAENIQLSLILADRRTIWWEERFDVILQIYDAPWTGYWETYEDHLEYMHRIYRSLKPGGYYITGTTDYQADIEATVRKEKKHVNTRMVPYLDNMVSENKFNHYTHQRIHDLMETSLFDIETRRNGFALAEMFDASKEGYVLVCRALKTTVEIWVYTRPPDVEVLLLRRTIEAGWGKVFWQPITGTINIGETPDMAAIRELEEESGITVWNKFVDLDSPFYFPTKALGTLHKTIYAVEVEKQSITIDPHEHDAFQWIIIDRIAEKLYWDSNVKGFGLFREYLASQSFPG